MPAGNLWVHDGDNKEDLGLFVKHARKGMCVPDYVQAQPDNDGWVYSQALVAIIEQYRVGHPGLPFPTVLCHPLLCETSGVLQRSQKLSSTMLRYMHAWFAL